MTYGWYSRLHIHRFLRHGNKNRRTTVSRNWTVSTTDLHWCSNALLTLWMGAPTVSNHTKEKLSFMLRSLYRGAYGKGRRKTEFHPLIYFHPFAVHLKTNQNCRNFIRINNMKLLDILNKPIIGITILSPCSVYLFYFFVIIKNYLNNNCIDKRITKLRGFNPQANTTDRATAACQRSQCKLLCHVVSATDIHGR
jgi:hypothetical protein